MSDVQTEDKPDEAVTADLEQIRQLAPAVVYARGAPERFVAAVEASLADVQFDASTPEGREAIRAAAFRVRQIKSAIDQMGKALTEVWRQKTLAVNASRTMVRERLDHVIHTVRLPLTQFEIAEEQRVLEHEQALTELDALSSWPGGVVPTAEQIEARLEIAKRRTNRDWQEFTDRHARTSADVIQALETALVQARQRELDAAELATLRAEAARAARAEAERVQEERERHRAEQVAAALLQKQAAEHARELQEAREREQALLRREEAARQMAEARVLNEQIRINAAIAQAAREQAQAAEQAAAAEAKRTSTRQHQDKVRKAVVAGMVEASQIGQVPAGKLLDAIIEGKFEPHVRFTY